jgi:sirohydrochlorin ferrochelatase
MNTKGIGAMIVTHGGSLVDEWGELFLNSIDDAGITIPTEVAWLIQGDLASPNLSERIKSLIKGGVRGAVDSLESKGIDKIVVVSYFVSSYGSEQDRLKYILGLMPIPEGGVGLKGFDLSQVLKPKAKIYLTPAMDDHQLVVDTLFERAKELTKKPEDDAVLIVTRRSPASKSEQKKENMNVLSNKLKNKGRFKEVTFEFLSDKFLMPGFSADEDSNKIKETIALLKSKVEGSVIVLPLFLSDGSLNREGVPKIINGLGCLYNPKVLLPHRNVSKWLKEMVEEGIKHFQ